MTKVNNNLSDILDLEPLKPLEKTEENQTFDVVETHEENVDIIDEDTAYARENIKKLIDKGLIAMDQILVIAKEAESARGYEVASTLMKNISELNKDLLELQKRKKDLAPKDYNSKQNINVDKAVVFTGSTTELIKLIKQQKE